MPLPPQGRAATVRTVFYGGPGRRRRSTLVAPCGGLRRGPAHGSERQRRSPFSGVASEKPGAPSGSARLFRRHRTYLISYGDRYRVSLMRETDGARQNERRCSPSPPSSVPPVRRDIVCSPYFLL